MRLPSIRRWVLIGLAHAWGIDSFVLVLNEMVLILVLDFSRSSTSCVCG